MEKILYNSLNKPVVKCIKNTNKTLSILDIGCGTGLTGKYLKSNVNCQVTGMTYSNNEAEIASSHLDKVLIEDLNYVDCEKLGKFDYIIASHVLEHLYYPSNLLNQLRFNLNKNGVLIVALPNVLHFR